MNVVTMVIHMAGMCLINLIADNKIVIGFEPAGPGSSPEPAASKPGRVKPKTLKLILVTS